ncbi:MAG: GNAT family N-acetyltransferase [Candidatus Bipolaricaulota bacterium]
MTMTTPWPDGWIDRAAQWEDVQQVAEMLNARSRKLFGEDQLTIDDIRAWWGGPRMNLASDLRFVVDDAGRIAGIASANDVGEPYAEISCSATVHPLYEDRAPLWDWLHSWALRRVAAWVPRAAEGIRVAAVTQMSAADPARRSSAERLGFRLVRVANRMRIDLSSPTPPPEWPAGVEVRTADIDADLPDIVRMQSETWRDHWGFIERPFDEALREWREDLSRPGNSPDASLWFLAVDGREIVGISLCQDRVVDDKTRGYVDALGVRPAWRKRGIALALLRHTFAEFRRREYATVELDMDSQNLTGALRVYERAGMRAARQAFSYEKILRPGIDLATRELRPSVG